MAGAAYSEPAAIWPNHSCGTVSLKRLVFADRQNTGPPTVGNMSFEGSIRELVSCYSEFEDAAVCFPPASRLVHEAVKSCRKGLHRLPTNQTYFILLWDLGYSELPDRQLIRVNALAQGTIDFCIQIRGNDTVSYFRSQRRFGYNLVITLAFVCSVRSLIATRMWRPFNYLNDVADVQPCS